MIKVTNVKVYSVKWNGKNVKEIQEFNNKFNLNFTIEDDKVYIDENMFNYVNKGTIIYYIPKLGELFFK